MIDIIFIRVFSLFVDALYKLYIYVCNLYHLIF